jgi:hypothetical protein
VRVSARKSGHRFAATAGFRLIAAIASAQAQPSQPLVRVEPASQPRVLPATQPVLKKKPAPPRQCKPGEMDQQCFARSEEAVRLIMDVASQCPDCVPPGAKLPMHAGKPVRPKEFCDAVEKLARIQGMPVRCQAL